MQNQFGSLRPLVQTLMTSAVLAFAVGMPLNVAHACKGKNCSHAAKAGKEAKCSCGKKGEGHTCSKENCSGDKCGKECTHHAEHAKDGAQKAAPADEHESH